MGIIFVVSTLNTVTESMKLGGVRASDPPFYASYTPEHSGVERDILNILENDLISDESETKSLCAKVLEYSQLAVSESSINDPPLTHLDYLQYYYLGSTLPVLHPSLSGTCSLSTLDHRILLSTYNDSSLKPTLASCSPKSSMYCSFEPK